MRRPAAVRSSRWLAALIFAAAVSPAPAAADAVSACRQGAGPGAGPEELRDCVRRALGGDEDRFRVSRRRLEEAGDDAGLAILLQAWAYVRRFDAGAAAEARELLEEAERHAEADGDVSLLASVLVDKASVLLFLADATGTIATVERLRGMTLPGGGHACNRPCLFFLANSLWQLGRFAEASDVFAQVLERSREVGDRRRLPLIEFSKLGADLSLENLVNPDLEAARASFVARYEEVLRLAREVDYPRIETHSHLLLGKLMGGAEGERHLEICIAQGRERGFDDILLHCLNRLAATVVRRDPERARALRAEAERIVLPPGNERWVAIGWTDAATVDWALLPRQQAAWRSLIGLEQVEVLRALQGRPSTRAEFFSEWVDVYSALAGRLLDPAYGEPSAADLATAFHVMERLRARVLLETLAQAQAAPPEPRADDPRVQRRQALLLDVFEHNRKLLAPDLTAERRRQLEASLDQLRREAARLTTSDPAYRVLQRPSFASLAEVQRALAEDEALLSFQIAPRENILRDVAGGSWLMVVTRDAVRSLPLPEGRLLRFNVETYLDLFPRRDGREESFSRRLYDELMGDALAALPPAIERLVIVPDGILHLLPFAALIDGEGRVLARRYRLSVVPSASLWWRWRQQREAGGGALILADPQIAAPEGAGRLPALPAAAAEGRRVARRLGSSSRLLAGAAASEHALKQADLAAACLLHFAAHAVVDEEKTETSAVMLAPGGGDDGPLSVPEIVELELDGKVVVLSACSSASGRVLNGEGVMSLARAFFQAGAVAVIGSLWPLRDDQAALLFDAFYRHLGRGESLAGALRAAQLDRIATGAPAADWAGVEVFGNGAFVPFPGGVRPAADPRRLALWSGLALFLGLAVSRRWR
ncbi:MAG: CHAT domain-containing protein [Acidobacteria bacterium]|nr:MAG: CHAT domain-containing protein [Acidobacteriota bacterium]